MLRNTLRINSAVMPRLSLYASSRIFTGFDAVRAEQKKIVRPHGRRQGAEEARKIGVIEIADGAAEKDEQSRQVFIDGGDAVFVTRVQAMKRYLRKSGCNGVPRSDQTRAAHIDGREDTRTALAHLLGQQVHGFFAKTGAKLGDAAHRRAGDNVSAACASRIAFSVRVR